MFSLGSLVTIASVTVGALALLLSWFLSSSVLPLPSDNGSFILFCHTALSPTELRVLVLCRSKNPNNWTLQSLVSFYSVVCCSPSCIRQLARHVLFSWCCIWFALCTALHCKIMSDASPCCRDSQMARQILLAPVAQWGLALHRHPDSQGSAYIETPSQCAMESEQSILCIDNGVKNSCFY